MKRRALLLLLAAAGFAQEAPELHKIYVPYTKLEEVLGTDKERVMVPYQEFLELWKLKYGPKAEPGKPPVPFVVESATYDSPFCMELGPGRALEPIGVFRFLNHSCDPNCELFFYVPAARGNGRQREPADRLWLKSLRRIAIGEELTIDYAWPAERAIPCLCGAANCRGWIVASEETFQIANCKLQIEK